ncbi:hypothetical protein QBC32DRAFT_78347 [Pseudoneurospora amorphoporcata]|uniref:Uncharacterized protein n=1 Tax=Pseudoneurospora amorphoporcata TaxID=241081 RepID=A0AAN6SBM8_9PEZI|nr:hypothetical protein QBC32DRAFT_78347 [Pseudoneurospora amorphoporcata]
MLGLVSFSSRPCLARSLSIRRATSLLTKTPINRKKQRLPPNHPTKPAPTQRPRKSGFPLYQPEAYLVLDQASGTKELCVDLYTGSLRGDNTKIVALAVHQRGQEPPVQGGECNHYYPLGGRIKLFKSSARG